MIRFMYELLVNRQRLNGQKERQQATFDAFLRTQSYELSSGWENRGPDRPIDFLNRRLRIGVELTEWRGEEQSRWVEERDRFQQEILDAIDERNIAVLKRGSGQITAEIVLENGPPRRREKLAVINGLLGFLQHFVSTAPRSRFQAYGICGIQQAELPLELRSLIHTISLYVFPYANLGIVVRKWNGLNPLEPYEPTTTALKSFRQCLKEKTVIKADRYRREKDHLQLQQLWLIVHYSSPGVFVEPLHELQMDIGYGGHRHNSQSVVAKRLRPIVAEVGVGPFDRVYFLVDCQPNPFAELIYDDRYPEVPSRSASQP